MRRGEIVFWLDDRRPSSYPVVALGWTVVTSGARFTYCLGKSGCVVLVIAMGRVFTISATGSLWKL
jgi:hypothetical protein